MLRSTSVRTVLLTCLLTTLSVAASPGANTSSELRAFVTEVLNQNPEVQAAQAAVNAARAREEAAGRPLFNPELELDVEKADVSTAYVGINQTVDWGDKRGARSSVASFAHEAARAELAAVREMVAGELLSALADLNTARKLNQLGQRRVDIMTRFEHIAERRRKAGDLGQVELALARLAATEARLQQAQAATTAAEAHQALSALMGDVRPRLPTLSTELPDVELNAQQIKSLLDELPAMRAQRHHIAASRSRIELRDRERKPDPTLGIRGGGESDDLLLGINLSVPLFVRNDFQAEVDTANAELIQAQQEGQNAYRRAKAQLIFTAERYRLTREAWLHWEQAGQANLESQIDLLQRIWQAGEMGTTDYLVQLKQTLDTQASAVELRGQFWRAWFEWLAASGRVHTWLALDPLTPGN